MYNYNINVNDKSILKLNSKFEIKLTEDFIKEIQSCLKKIVWFENDMGVVWCFNQPVNEYLALENIKTDILWGENDEILHLEIEAVLIKEKIDIENLKYCNALMSCL